MVVPHCFRRGVRRDFRAALAHLAPLFEEPISKRSEALDKRPWSCMATRASELGGVVRGQSELHCCSSRRTSTGDQNFERGKNADPTLI